MAATRRDVFVEKVLKRLFLHDLHGQEKAALPVASEISPEKLVPDKGGRGHVSPSAGGSNETPASWRLYTVALPPEGYVPALVSALELSSPSNSEHASSSDDSDSDSDSDSDNTNDAGDQDPHDQPKRRRIRKHKSKKKCKNPSSGHEEQAELEKQQSLLQEKLQPQHTDGPTISKNKKRKLKKRQQMERKRAAGLLKPSGISFLYEPVEEPTEEQGDAREGDAAPAGGDAAPAEGDAAPAEGGAAPAEGGAAPAEGGAAQPGDAKQDSGNGADEKAEEILDFFKATQEIYFYDGVSKDLDPAFLKATEELMRSLEARSVPLADLLVLDHMKMLLLLQAPERLQRALQVFVEQCSVPPEQAKVISAFFNYWLTHVLPEQP